MSEYRLQVGVFERVSESTWPKISGRPRINYLCMGQASECLTTLSLTVFAQRNFVADFLRKIHLYTKNGQFPFLNLLWELSSNACFS